MCTFFSLFFVFFNPPDAININQKRCGRPSPEEQFSEIIYFIGEDQFEASPSRSPKITFSVQQILFSPWV
jgi:hypothetical protein